MDRNEVQRFNDPRVKLVELPENGEEILVLRRKTPGPQLPRGVGAGQSVETPRCVAVEAGLSPVDLGNGRIRGKK